MEITDMKKGTTFLGYYISPETGIRNIFEAIIVNTDDSVRNYSGNKTRIRVDALTVIIKSDNPENVGKMELMFFSNEDLEKFQVTPTHFVSMENIYPILHTYNPSDNYESIRLTQINDEGESIPINSLLCEENPVYSVHMLKMNNGHLIQMIVLQETSCMSEYENPFVWVNIVTNDDELLLPTNPRTFVSRSIVNHYQNVRVENINSNPRINSLLGSIFPPTPQEQSHFNGIGIFKDDELELMIFDTSTEEERLNWGNGIYVKDDF